MIKIEQIALPVEAGEDALIRAISKLLRISPEDIRSLEIRKRSLDARKKPELYYVYSAAVSVKRENEILRRNKNRKISAFDEPSYSFPDLWPKENIGRPVIAGSGPAGLFCALMLAEHGFRPIVLERGDEVERRLEKVSSFWENGVLDPCSNVQFGEGGAGTFSDGKLNTMTHDPNGRGRYVLEKFVRFGADPEILYDQKPHLGTDRLTGILKEMRKAVEAAGGEFRFRSRLTDISVNNGKLTGILVNSGERLDTGHLVLAVGHSARDTYEMLLARGVAMTPKPFAVGLRVQHPQEMIDRSQYGRTADGVLPAAAYKLTFHDPAGRGVYTFCMCPGGYVVNASSEEKRLAVNGMSYHARDGINANSAVIVSVGPADFRLADGASGGILGGVFFQRMLEERAFRAAGGAVPTQRWEDYVLRRPSSAPGDVQPAIRGRYEMTALNGILPAAVEDAFCGGIRAFGRKIEGFDRPDMLLCGVESRTSSPIRMERNERGESNIGGVYPCGEGAGYAGGITSAAVDGIRTAEAVAASMCRK